MEGFFCGEKKEKDLEFHPVVHIFDSLEGNEYVSFQGGGALAIRNSKILLYVTCGVGLGCTLERKPILS